MENKHDFLTAIGIGLSLTLGCLALIFSMIKNDQERIGSDYSIKQVQQFDQITFTEMYNDFTGSSDDAQKYSKNKSNLFKRTLLTHALKRNDLDTLMQIYKKNPTKINKIYALACAWNNKYDNDNLTKYGKALNYYTQHLTKQDKKLVSPFLKQVTDSSISDPTGEVQKRAVKLESFGLLSDTPIER